MEGWSVIVINNELKVVNGECTIADSCYASHSHAALQGVMNEYWILGFFDRWEMGFELWDTDK